MKGHNHSGIDDTVIFLHTLDFYVTTRYCVRKHQ
jgi:hypothetical protein